MAVGGEYGRYLNSALSSSGVEGVQGGPLASGVQRGSFVFLVFSRKHHFEFRERCIALAKFKTPNYNSTIWLFVHPYTERVYDKIK